MLRHDWLHVVPERCRRFLQVQDRLRTRILRDLLAKRKMNGNDSRLKSLMLYWRKLARPYSVFAACWHEVLLLLSLIIAPERLAKSSMAYVSFCPSVRFSCLSFDALRSAAAGEQRVWNSSLGEACRTLDRKQNMLAYHLLRALFL